MQDTSSSEPSRLEQEAPTSQAPSSPWRRFGLLTLLQVATQTISIITGFLLVRWLPKTEFAWFTLGNSSTSVFTTLVEPGAGLGMQSLGGRVLGEPEKFRQSLASVLSLRWRLGLVSALLSLPLPLWLLLENGAPLLVTLLILGANVLGFFALLTNGSLSAALKLQGKFRQALLSEFASVLARLLLVGAAALFWINAIVATLAAVLATAWQYLILRNTSRSWLQNLPQPSAEQQSQLLEQVQSMRMYNLFQFVQGQVAVWLLSITANVAAVADLGALNRLGAIFAALAVLYYQLYIPALSRTQGKRRLVSGLWLGAAAYMLAVVLFTLAGWLGAPWILWLFGTPYMHLTREVPWMIASLGIYTFTVILWWFNTSRGWVRLARLNPSLTAVVMAATYFALRPDTVLEIIWFSTVALAPSLILGLIAVASGLNRLPATESALSDV